MGRGKGGGGGGGMAEVKKFDSLIQATSSVKISNLHICFCSFDFSRPILEKDIFYRKLVYCIVLS